MAKTKLSTTPYEGCALCKAGAAPHSHRAYYELPPPKRKEPKKGKKK